MFILLATYGNVPVGNEIMKSLDDTMAKLAKEPFEETNVGQLFNQYERSNGRIFLCPIATSLK